MDGVHDMGGMDGFGKVEPEPNEPAFHDRWEGRVLAMSRAMRRPGEWNIDSRPLLDRDAAAGTSILTRPITRRWILRLENLCVARGLVTPTRSPPGHARRSGGRC